MPHLWTFRQGWQSENLAKYILYKFSFVAQPSAVADDIGSDFYCTLFQIENVGGRDYLTPTNAFTIQVKSNADRFNVTNKLSYLENLEIPFFVGVVDRNNLELTIYSGEYLPSLFSHYGVPDHLEINLCPREQINSEEDYVNSIGDRRYILNFPKFLTFSANISQSDLIEKSAKIARLCSLMLRNISAKINHEYTFLIPCSDITVNDPIRCWISQFAGPISVQSFRANLLRRLTEALFNMEWLRDNHHPDYNLVEHNELKRAVRSLERYYGELTEFENLRIHL